MSWMAIGGLVCLGFVVLVGAFVIYAIMDSTATEKRMRAHGKPVLAVLVMANAEFLQNHSIPSAPALSLFSFEPPSPQLANDMREIASELFALYTADTDKIVRLPEPQQQMAERLKDDGYQDNRRTQVVSEMSRGHTLYLADTYIQRAHIPDHVA